MANKIEILEVLIDSFREVYKINDHIIDKLEIENGEHILNEIPKEYMSNFPYNKCFREATYDFDLFIKDLEEYLEELKSFESKFKVGETIIYQNGDSFELGVVKKVLDNKEYFINYHMGETAARTHERNIHKIKNEYAFDIKRKTVE